MAKLNSGTRIYGNVTVDTFITATGNITGGNLSGTSIVGTLTTAAQTNITSVGTLTGLTLSGNISGTGVTLTGSLKATGPGDFDGGLQSTPIGNVAPSTALFTSIGSSGNTTVSALTVNANATIGTTLGVTGNISGSGVTLTGSLVATGSGDFDGGLQSTPIGNAAASTATFTTLVATGTSSLNGTVSTNNILPFGNANANIGSTSLRFNTVFAKATSAQYADLAEIYIADLNYPPGTVVVFGGSKEITVTSTAHDTRVAGVISTNPAYLMNSEVQGLPVALTGRVPCLVQGPINKGEVLVTGLKPGTAQKINPARFQPGCVIGKSIENIPDDELKLIEIVVGRF